MLCIIVGVIVVIGSDTGLVYGVAVRLLRVVLNLRWRRLGCGVSISCFCRHHSGRQYIGLWEWRLKASRGCWFYPLVHGGGECLITHTRWLLLMTRRLFGSFISDQVPRRPIAALSIHLLSTRKPLRSTETADRCLMHSAVDQIQQVRLLRCIHPPTLMDLKPPPRYLGSPAAQLARRVTSRPNLVSELHRRAMWLSIPPVCQNQRFLIQRSILTERRPSIHTMPTPKTPTRSVSASTRFWKCRMSVEDGGKRENRPATPVLLRPTIWSYCDLEQLVFPVLLPIFWPKFLWYPSSRVAGGVSGWKVMLCLMAIALVSSTSLTSMRLRLLSVHGSGFRLLCPDSGASIWLRNHDKVLFGMFCKNECHSPFSFFNLNILPDKLS